MKRMKQVIAGLLSATMVMSMSMTALAEESAGEQKETTVSTKVMVSTNLQKSYRLSGSTTEGLKPFEKLEFTSSPDSNNPTNANLEDITLTINDSTLNGDKPDQYLECTLPAYTKVGTYKYTLNEKQGQTQGVAYNTESTISLVVSVVYDYEDKKDDDYGDEAKDNNILAVETVAVSKNAQGLKAGSIENEYKLGKLKVGKTVEGNLASQDQPFTINVKFTSDKIVLSDIITDYYEDNKLKVLSYVDWKEEDNGWSYDISLDLKHGDEVTFTDIPVGVEYTVDEDDKYDVAKGSTDTTGANPEKGYEVSGEVLTAQKISEAGKEYQVTVTNKKDSNVDTGIILDSAPYVLLLALAGLGAFAVVSKKREEEF